MRCCARCNDSAPPGGFRGSDSYCRDCRRDATREWRAANPTKYAKQKLDGAASQRASEATPEGRMRKQNRERAGYARNRPARQAIGRAAYAVNPQPFKDRARARKALTPHSSEVDRYAATVRLDPCSYCGGPGGQSDHIVALSQGGEHAVSNLTGTCASCNVRKGTQPLLLFMLRERELSAALRERVAA